MLFKNGELFDYKSESEDKHVQLVRDRMKYLSGLNFPIRVRIDKKFVSIRKGDGDRDMGGIEHPGSHGVLLKGNCGFQATRNTIPETNEWRYTSKMPLNKGTGYEFKPERFELKAMNTFVQKDIEILYILIYVMKRIKFTDNVAYYDERGVLQSGFSGYGKWVLVDTNKKTQGKIEFNKIHTKVFNMLFGEPEVLSARKLQYVAYKMGIRIPPTANRDTMATAIGENIKRINGRAGTVGYKQFLEYAQVDEELAFMLALAERAKEQAIIEFDTVGKKWKFTAHHGSKTICIARELPTKDYDLAEYMKGDRAFVKAINAKLDYEPPKEEEFSDVVDATTKKQGKK